MSELLAARYRELLPEGATVGGSIISLRTGRTLFAVNDTLPLIPASTLKLIVTGHALEHWDPGWDSSIAAALPLRLVGRNPTRGRRIQSDPEKKDSLALLLQDPDAPDWPFRRQLLCWVNRHSDNQLADLMLAAALSGRKTARPETLYAAWLERRGIPAAGLRMADGSGLSRRNRLTARTLTGLLAALRDTEDRELVHSLARPGGHGTLNRRGLGLGSRVRAKTGYIREVFTLAGYLHAQTDTFAFAFLANDCPEPRAAYRLFTGLLLTTFRWNATDTLGLPPIRPDRL